MNHILHIIGWMLALFLFCTIIVIASDPQMEHRNKWHWGALLSAILYMIAVTLIRW
jgi:hypothetical protein